MSDLGDLRLNFTDKEASSQGRSYEPVPTGWYPVFITDGSIEECGPNSKNPGKPYWNLEMTVIEGHKYDGRRFWGSIMLFEGALYSLSQLLKALGYEVTKGKVKVPPLTDVIGKRIDVSIVKQADKYKMEQAKAAGEQNPELVQKNEVKGYRAPRDSAVTAGKSAAGSLLPG